MVEPGVTIPATEFELAVDGQVLAGKSWGDSESPVILALHGWRDNAATFDRLGPMLASSFRIHALDLPGHGLSSHRLRQGDYTIWSYVGDVLASLDVLGVEKVDLLGHSMGGAVAGLFSACFPERVRRLVMLDALGPLSVAPADAPAQLRKSLLQKRDWNPAERSYYRSREAAIEARARVGLQFDSAALLAARSLDSEGDNWYWRTDRRLTRANPLSLSEPHVIAFLDAIRCPALLVKATGGDYWDKHADTLRDRLASVRELTVAELPGHHHQHLEGQVVEVATAVGTFLSAP